MDFQNWDYTVFEQQSTSVYSIISYLEKSQQFKGKGAKQVNRAQQAGGGEVQIITQKKGDHTNKHPISNAFIAKVCNEEEYKVQTVSHDLKLAIQQARMDKGWTQEQLAKVNNVITKIIKQIMEKKSVINDYEAGRAIPNQFIIGKIERALGVKFDKQKKKKQQQQQKY